MSSAIISLDIKDKTPDKVFFLMRYTYLYRDHESVNLTTEQLATSLGLKVSSTGSIRQKLVYEGWLDNVYIPTSGKGRPISATSVSSRLLDRVEEIEENYIPCNSLLRNLMLDDFKIEKQLHELKSVTRIILATLLFHSDELGRSVLSYGDFEKKVGVKRGRLHRHLNELIEAGYIRSIINGLTCSELFGVVKTVYYLNLSHPSYDSSIKPSRVYFYKPLRITDNEGVPEAFSLTKTTRNLREYFIDERRRSGWRGIREPDTALTMESLIFKGQVSIDLIKSYPGAIDFVKDGSISAYFQMKINDITGLMLSSIWGQLESCKRFKEQNLVGEDDFKEVIKEQFISNSLLRESELSGRPTSEQVESIVQLIFDIALQKALYIKELLLEVGHDDIEFDNSDFLIIPSVYRAYTSLVRYYAFIIFPRSSASIRKPCFEISSKGEDISVNEIEENEVLEEDALLAGLRAPGLSVKARFTNTLEDLIIPSVSK